MILTLFQERAEFRYAFSRERSDFDDLERPRHAVMFADGNVVARHEGMGIELEERLVAFVRLAVVKAPAVADMLEHAMFFAVVTPEAAYAASQSTLPPGVHVNMSGRRQWSNELVAVPAASLRKLVHAPELETDVGESNCAGDVHGNAFSA